MIHHISLFIFIYFLKNTIRSPSIIRVGGKETKEDEKNYTKKKKNVRIDRKNKN